MGNHLNDIVLIKHLFFVYISYMSAHVLLNLLNELRKNDKMRGFIIFLQQA